ncbi:MULTISPECIES: TolC family protein [Campylobacter]|uniref:TolC family protein n=1 Tax=Campylobacter TaxID=194 RepID=UPI000A354356|nr:MULTISPECIES: TolC family protein [unclassified Campylobacter]MCR8678328.1 TolC family protein [Campylobacter sp. RM19072]MCR8695679.1 TolC family protein [Campylobacter sp. RM19073]
MRYVIAIFIAFIISGCASKKLDYEIKEVEFYTPSWYKDFNQTTLNELIDLAMKNSEDLSKAALNLEIAMLNANVASDGYIPSFGGEIRANSSRDISRSDGFSSGFNSKFNISYELDIFGKIYDKYKSKEWLWVASRSTLENLRLTIINQVANIYFNILYLNDSLRSLNQNLDNAKMLDELVRIKYENGKEEFLSIKQSSQNILRIQNQIQSTQRSLELNYESLKNLTRSDMRFDELSLSEVGFVGIGGFDIGELSNRPDISEAIANLNSSFYQYRLSQKDLLPTFSLGASLSDGDSKFKNSFDFNQFGGVLSFSLPFLDYYKLKKYIKISELEFNKLRLSYEQTLKNAINEVIKYINFYQTDSKTYENLIVMRNDQAKIVEIYKSKYDEGSAELKDLLEAQDSLISTQISLINQKFELLNDELSYYKAIAK